MIAVRAAAMAAVLSACMAQAAVAATVTLDYEPPLPGIEPEAGYTLTVRGDDETNRTAIASDAGGYTVRNENGALAPGSGCTAVDPNQARCATPQRAGRHSLFVDGGGNDDILAVSTHSPAIKVELRGGTGDDLLLGGTAGDLLVGGSGDDSLVGGDGNDRLDGGAGSDLLEGAAGTDTVTYGGRSASILADLAAGTGGEQGEDDEYGAVEDLTGGRGSDRLLGDDGPNTLLGGTGKGRDWVMGRGGDDQLLAHHADGGSGNDRIGATVYTCGPGEDILFRTLTRPRGAFPRACETVQSGAVFIRPDPVRHSRRRLVYALRCLWDDAFCAARLVVRDRRGRIGTKRFRLPPGGPNGPVTRVTVRLERPPRSRIGVLHVVDQRLYEDDWFRTRLR